MLCSHKQQWSEGANYLRSCSRSNHFSQNVDGAEESSVCYLWLDKFETVKRIQLEYHSMYNDVTRKIRQRDQQLWETVRLLDQKCSGRPSVSDEKSAEAIRDTHLKSQVGKYKCSRTSLKDCKGSEEGLNELQKAVCYTLSVSLMDRSYVTGSEGST